MQFGEETKRTKRQCSLGKLPLFSLRLEKSCDWICPGAGATSEAVSLDYSLIPQQVKAIRNKKNHPIKDKTKYQPYDCPFKPAKHTPKNHSRDDRHDGPTQKKAIPNLPVPLGIPLVFHFLLRLFCCLLRLFCCFPFLYSMVKLIPQLVKNRQAFFEVFGGLGFAISQPAKQYLATGTQISPDLGQITVFIRNVEIRNGIPPVCLIRQLLFQLRLQQKCTFGFVFHCFLGDGFRTWSMFFISEGKLTGDKAGASILL